MTIPVEFSAKELGGKDFFKMVGSELRVKSKLLEGNYTIKISADAGNAHAEHVLEVVVMADRDKYPVFPQLTYDIEVNHKFGIKFGIKHVMSKLIYKIFQPRFATFIAKIYLFSGTKKCGIPNTNYHVRSCPSTW